MPTNKKYVFAVLLKEFNERYRKHYILSTCVSNCTLIHYYEDSVLSVGYDHESTILRQGLPFSDFIYRFVSPSLSSSDFKAMVLQKTQDKSNTKIEIWPANKIRYAYLDSHTFTKKGPLGNSCMRHKGNQKSLNFYVKNNVKIVVVTDDKNKIYARALLWGGVNTTSRKSTVTYLDRVYAISDAYILQFNTLAKENKWHYYNSTSAGKAKCIYYIDNIDIKGICHLPYTDTFRFLFHKDGVVASSPSSIIVDKANVKHANNYISLTNTVDGGYIPELDPNRVEEALTNNCVSKKDCIRIKRYNGYVLKTNIVDIGGDYYSKHDNKIIESKLDGFILAENSIKEVVTNEVIDKTKAIKSAEYNGYLHKSSVINIKGTLYHKKDTDTICYSSTWYHISQCFINYDREKANEELSSLPLHCTNPCPHYVSRAAVTRIGSIIPKKYAIIAYDLIYSPVSGNIEYQEVYCIDTTGIIQLNTGELIRNLIKNKQYLKKFNGKYYIKKEFKLPNKKQLMLFEGIK